MTEIQWLVDIMLNHKLAEPVKARFIARIGEVEASLSRPLTRNLPAGPIGVSIQAPSTQKLLDDMAMHPVMPAVPPAQRVVGGEVNTGNGTRGPRKF